MIKNIRDLEKRIEENPIHMIAALQVAIKYSSCEATIQKGLRRIVVSPVIKGIKFEEKINGEWSMIPIPEGKDMSEVVSIFRSFIDEFEKSREPVKARVKVL